MPESTGGAAGAALNYGRTHTNSPNKVITIVAGRKVLVTPKQKETWERNTTEALRNDKNFKPDYTKKLLGDTKPSAKPSVKPSSTAGAKPNAKPSAKPYTKPVTSSNTYQGPKVGDIKDGKIATFVSSDGRTIRWEKHTPSSSTPSAKPSKTPSVKPSATSSAKPKITKPSKTPKVKPSTTSGAKPSAKPATGGFVTEDMLDKSVRIAKTDSILSNLRYQRLLKEQLPGWSESRGDRDEDEVSHIDDLNERVHHGENVSREQLSHNEPSKKLGGREDPFNAKLLPKYRKLN